MIVFDNVTCAYPGAEPVFKGLSFDIQEGERVALVGANGAGKSTLMKAALGLLPSKGRITIEGLDVNAENLAEIRKTLGFVLQNSDNQLFMPTVIEDMIFGPINYGKSREEAEAVADAALAELDVEYLRDKHNHKISGGEKRMAAIATILAMEPKYVLMDEPSASLDPRNRRMLINALNKLSVTRIIATHDLDMVLECCDRVILLGNGGIVADGPALEILSDRELLEANSLELPFCMAGLPMAGLPGCVK